MELGASVPANAHELPSVENRGRLIRYDPATGAVSEGAAPPLSAQEGLSYLAVNPADPLERVVATSALKLYRSTDGGSTWQDITP